MEIAHDAAIRPDAQALAYTGKGTPAGDLLRRFWHPIALPSDLRDGEPLNLRILGEDLVLFRDDAGRLGLVGRQCPHRCADLSYGRVEDGGLRCIYHGWLFDIEGRCLEKPGEPGAGRQSLDSARHLAYPCREAAGGIWAYMGPGEPPLFPNYPALLGPEKYRTVTRWAANCNYLQGNEGNIDPVHTSFLHRGDLSDATGLRQKSLSVFGIDTAPRLSVEEQRFGVRVFTERKAGPGKKILRVTNFVMPNACAIGGSETGLGRGGCSMFWHVPIDDRHHYRFEFVFHSKEPLPKEEWARQAADELDQAGRLKRGPDNRWLQDRDSMRKQSFLGMGILFPVHDLFVTESQGSIHERANEHLSGTDIAIVRMRRQMLAALQEIEEGKDPRGVLRTEQENDFRDMLVLTETLDENVDNHAFCAELSRQNIYALNPNL
jgi:nitrite reductase/ring-hydroxylating ferredoxin subunit